MIKNLILLIIISLSLFNCSNSQQSADAYGNFETDEILISSEVGGQILTLNIKEGGSIKKDSIIAIIDTTQLILQKQELIEKIKALDLKKKSALNKLAAQKIRINNLKKEKERIKRLLKDSAATEKQWDEITTNFKIAQKELNSLKNSISEIDINKKSMLFKLKQLENKINKCYIKTPINGTILEKFVNNYEIINPGRPICKIANLKQMYLRAYITGDMLSKIKIGQNVTVFFDKNKKELEQKPGKIIWISSSAEFTPKIIQTKNVRVDLVYAIKILVNNEDGKIKIGMPGEVKF